LLKKYLHEPLLHFLLLSAFIFAFPLVGSASVRPQIKQLTCVLALPTIVCSFSQAVHFTLMNLLFGSFIICFIVSVLQLEFPSSETRANVRFFACVTAVSKVYFFSGFIATWNLGEFSTVADTGPPFFLSRDVC